MSRGIGPYAEPFLGCAVIAAHNFYVSFNASAASCVMKRKAPRRSKGLFVFQVRLELTPVIDYGIRMLPCRVDLIDHVGARTICALFRGLPLLFGVLMDRILGVAPNFLC